MIRLILKSFFFNPLDTLASSQSNVSIQNSDHKICHNQNYTNLSQSDNSNSLHVAMQCSQNDTSQNNTDNTEKVDQIVATKEKLLNKHSNSITKTASQAETSLFDKHSQQYSTLPKPEKDSKCGHQRSESTNHRNGSKPALKRLKTDSDSWNSKESTQDPPSKSTSYALRCIPRPQGILFFWVSFSG